MSLIGLTLEQKMYELEMAARSTVDSLAAKYAHEAQNRFTIRCQERGYKSTQDVYEAHLPKDDPLMIDVTDIVEWKNAAAKVYAEIYSALKGERIRLLAKQEEGLE